MANYREFYEETRRRKRKAAQRRFVAAIVVLGVVLAAALLLGELLFPEERGLEFFSGVILPAGNLIVCFGLPLLGVLCKSLWERGEGRDISCGEKSQKSEDIVSAKKSEKKKKKA